MTYAILEPHDQPERLAFKLLRSFKNTDLGYRGNPLEVAARFGHTKALPVLLSYPEMLTGSPFVGYRSLVERIVKAALNGLSITQALSSSQLELAVKQHRLSLARMILHAFLDDYKRRRDENTDEYGDGWFSRLGYSRDKKLAAINELITAFEDQQTNIKTLATLAKTHPAVKDKELGEIYNAVKEFFKFKEQLEKHQLSRDEKRRAEREPQPSSADSKASPRPKAGLFDAKLGPVEAQRQRLAGVELTSSSPSSAALVESAPDQPEPEADGGLGKGGGGKGESEPRP